MKSRWILLRGLTRGNGHWGVFPDLLTEAGFDVELMEIPGNGTQFRRTTPTDPDEVLRDLKSRSRHVSSGQPYSLLGISLGGMMALKWAESADPNLFHVAVVNTSLRQFSPLYCRLAPARYFDLIKAAMTLDPWVREQSVLKMTSRRPEVAAEYLEAFSKFSSLHPVSLKNLFRQLLLASKVSINKPFQVPVTVISAMGDQFVHPDCSVAIAKGFVLPHFTLQTAGHDLPLDDPEGLVRILVGIDSHQANEAKPRRS